MGSDRCWNLQWDSNPPTQGTDRVYAFLGLVEPGYNIIPNYQASNSIHGTLCYSTKRIILHEAGLDVLALAQEDDRSDLPSWVPNWSTKCRELPFLRINYEASGSYPAIASIHSGLHTQQDRVLRVAGLIVDQLATEVTLSEPVQEIRIAVRKVGAGHPGNEGRLLYRGNRSRCILFIL